MLSEVKTEVEKLSLTELEELVSHIYGIITKMTAGTDEPQEIKCPLCESYDCVKNGTSKGKQRYVCRKCKKTFGMTTGTIKAYSKITDEQWKKYIECMILGYSLRKTAKIVGVCLKISFYLRHKILDSLRASLSGDEYNRLFGSAELDECFLSESFKGNHKKSGFEMPRKPRKRGKQSSKRGISKDKICIGTGADKNNLIIKMICRGRASHKNLKDLYNGRIDSGTTVVTDGLSGYRKLTQNMGLRHVIIPPKKHANGAHNLQRINSLHSRFKEWVHRFHGVSTKLLPNYLGWFKFVEIFKSLSDSEKSGKIWRNATSEKVRSRMIDIRHRAVVFG